MPQTLAAPVATEPPAGGTRPLAILQARIAPLQQALAAHPLYGRLQTIADIRIFMQSHVYAVWDFMSLLKSLQRTLTCVDLPWAPSPFPASRRFINEIVLGEESDLYQGQPTSHFELYLQAMQQAGADTGPIRTMLHRLALGERDPWVGIAPSPAQAFVDSTFRTVRHGSPAAQAAAFAFGREDAIPAIFRALVRDLSRSSGGNLDTFLWYLERHIEVDGDDHGPLALQMVEDLCGHNPELWREATTAAEAALQARLTLWNGILQQLND